MFNILFHSFKVLMLTKCQLNSDIQVSRSIGDAYLKRPEFSLDPSFPRFQLPEPLGRPVLSAEPSVCTRVLQLEDRFIIFASDGLWEHMTNQEAVEIVHNSPREVFHSLLFPLS